MKLFQKLKEMKKDGFHLSDKHKYRLQGCAIGGAFATITLLCTALVAGCVANNDKGQEQSAENLAPVTLGEARPQNVVERNGYVADTTYVFDLDMNIGTAGTNVTYGTTYVTFVCNGVTYESLTASYWSDGSNYLQFGNSITDNALRPYVNGVWVDDVYRYISFPSGWNVPSGASSSWLRSYDFFRQRLTLYVPPVASSVETTEQSGEGADVYFQDKLAFSAWVRNPMTHKQATNYDASAPFILYTGTANPTDGSVLPSEYVVYEVGDFHIEGVPEAFNAIAVTTLALVGDESFSIGGDTLGIVSTSQVEQGAFVISNAYYVNTATDYRLKVMDIGSTRIENNGQAYNAIIGPQWLNSGYRHIHVDNIDLPLTINGLEATNGWWLQHNAIDSTSSISSFVLGNASTGVFGLIGNAFVSIASIMGIAIVPGLTIGTLMFIPLVVLLIVTIIKMVGK